MTLTIHDVAEGDALTPLVIVATATVIVAGALATRDFMPVHHDKTYAESQGAPDIFMNILSSNAYCSRFLTDWAGPEVMVRRVAIRLGVPVFPNSTLTFTGTVTAVEVATATVEVALQASTDMGDHLTGTASLCLPRGGANG
ncbi:MAG: acyl dehydratase [Acidimicrobiia bacterium]|nr:acyl dehydratase [Acidimicrobiia bacterium]